MELEKSGANGECHPGIVELPPEEAPPGYMEDIDSTCSTPYVSAPSSPGRGTATFAGGGGYFFSAPASPMHFVLSSAAFSSSASSAAAADSAGGSFEFEFSARYAASSVSSADELFLNGQIRPMKLSSHLRRPQILAPLLDIDNEDEYNDDENDEEIKDRNDLDNSLEMARGRDIRLRSGSIHRRTRSMSPMRNPRFHWPVDDEEEEEAKTPAGEAAADEAAAGSEKKPAVDTAPSSASSSRSSSSGRNSKRWIFLKDLLYRSKSEGRERAEPRHHNKDKFWHSISFSPSTMKDRSTKPASESAKQKQKHSSASAASASTTTAAKKMRSAARRGAAPSPHERHYTANRAQAEEMRKRTFLPYRQGLLGCLGFSSRSYGAMNGLARSLNTVYSR